MKNEERPQRKSEWGSDFRCCLRCANDMQCNAESFPMFEHNPGRDHQVERQGSRS